ncbi:hypothetical protein [uncultured Fusobacterium sp.]|uniref:hypothetical protein n=1 Tax=uncultured Fusobacterium sp. TaxID=159267 RepID=UPI0025D17FA2|nr:hypothetical protein [uncultured Fusobacterium sp.]
MLSEDAKLVIDFMEECRSQGTIKDELYTKVEEMYSALYQLEDLIKGNKEQTEVFLKLETLLIEVLNLTKDTYFEYGDNFAQVRESKFFKCIKEA